MEQDELFERADVLTIHTRLSRPHARAGRRARAGADEADGALLVNTSRGPIVDEEALLKALREGTIAGAALDVYDKEPLPADHPLRAAPHTMLTPHLGYVTIGHYELFYARGGRGHRRLPARRAGARAEPVDIPAWTTDSSAAPACASPRSPSAR